MDGDDLKALDKRGEKAQAHRRRVGRQIARSGRGTLPVAYEEIPGIAQATYDACKSWADANARLAAEHFD